MARLGLKLRESVKRDGVQKTYLALRESVAEKTVDLKTDFSLRETAQSFLGDNWHDQLKAWAGRNMGTDGVALRESAEAVDASAFAAITGQLLIDTVREKYKLATQVGNEIFSTMPITNGNLTTQREPWLSRVKHSLENINQGMPYPTTSFDPQYVDYPGPQKFGEICNVTFEMIFSDLTVQAVESAESVGEMTGVDEEERKLRVFLGAVNNHSWNGTAYNTYQAATPWINLSTTFALTDWNSVNVIEQLFAQMTDPTTGKPINIDPKDLFVMPTKKYTAKRILNATHVFDDPVRAAGAVSMETGNPLDTNYRLMTSKYARQIAIAAAAAGGLALSATVADTMTIWGDFKKAFGWRQVYPCKVTQAPPQNPWEFTQDIVLSVKSSCYGVAVVKDPRFVVKAYTA